MEWPPLWSSPSCRMAQTTTTFPSSMASTSVLRIWAWSPCSLPHICLLCCTHCHCVECLDFQKTKKTHRKKNITCPLHWYSLGGKWPCQNHVAMNHPGHQSRKSLPKVLDQLSAGNSTHLAMLLSFANLPTASHQDEARPDLSSSV